MEAGSRTWEVLDISQLSFIGGGRVGEGEGKGALGLVLHSIERTDGRCFT